MCELEEMKYRIELLKMARELLNEEYINRRAEDHNQWLANSESAWKTRGVKLPYPPFAMYPSENEIVAKATLLFNFVKPEESNALLDVDATDLQDEKPTQVCAELTDINLNAVSNINDTTLAAIVEPTLHENTPGLLSYASDPIVLSRDHQVEISMPEVGEVPGLVLMPSIAPVTQITEQTNGIKSLLPGWLHRTPVFNKGV